MDHTPSQEVNRSSASQGIAFTLCNPVTITVFTNSQSHIPILDHMICEGILVQKLTLEVFKCLI
jgi:hypothetical protein